MIKHPSNEILQDYFENALNSEGERLVKEHLLRCDQCTKMLADFTMIETRIRQVRTLEVSQTNRQRIFQNAHALLSEKRKKQEARQHQLDSMKNYFQEWKELLYPELRIPALQLCSISLVLATFIAFEKSASKIEQEFEPISSEVSVFTHDETNLKEKE